MSDNQIPDAFTKDSVPRFCDVLESLRKGSFENWLRRQTYEWKMCITIWTPLVGFLGILVTQRHVWFPWPPLAVVLTLWAAIHIVWQMNLKKSNDIDIAKMRSLCNMHAPDKRTGILVFPNWSHILYVVITLGLITSVLYTNSVKRSGIAVLPEDVQKTLDSKYGPDLVARDKWIGEMLHAQLVITPMKTIPTHRDDTAADPAKRAADNSGDIPAATPNTTVERDARKSGARRSP